MKITALQVKSLRQRTGAGMMDCKNTLIETEGDEEKAVDLIQKKGLAKVAKKAGAIAAEGLVHSYIHAGSKVGVLLEVNCQTDFVARNEDFKEFVDHLAMHIAAEKPEVVREEDLSKDMVDRQIDIFRGQLAEEAKETGKEKPAAAIERIIEGKLAKWKRGACLVEQIFLMSEDKTTVAGTLDALSAKIGEKLSIRRFARYELGEGIAKKTEDFAEEVAKTIANA